MQVMMSRRGFFSTGVQYGYFYIRVHVSCVSVHLVLFISGTNKAGGIMTNDWLSEAAWVSQCHCKYEKVKAQ